MTLLLDFGNTRLKWAALQGEQFTADGAVDWSDDVSKVLAGSWRNQARPHRVVAASVAAAEREQRVTEYLRNIGWPEPQWMRTPASACGVRNAYADPHRLGVDRFLTMVVARACAPSAAVLIGVGTALTLDALSEDGRHLGGLIAPGPRLMQRALLTGTAQVRPDGAGQITGLADNTADAVRSGCWGACAGLAERFVRKHGRALGGEPRVLLTGGDAAALQPLLEFPGTIVENAVLHGLAIWTTGQSPGSASDSSLIGRK